MDSPAEAYTAELNKLYATGIAREHSYRPALAHFLESLGVKASVVNEPKHSLFGAPDLVFKQGDLELGYIEAKDIGVSLDKVEVSEQMKRYLGYSNLILTDYLEFRFYKNGSRYGEPVRIGFVSGGNVIAQPTEFQTLVDSVKDFLTSPPERIKSGKRLAEIMGGKARRIRDNVRHFLADKEDADTDLQRVYESVKKMLVHDLTPDAFADMYAQTLVYGLFVARYYDESKDTFSRAEARDLVPESNPFLRQFFNHIAGVDFNKRLRYIVDELCVVFEHADVRELIDEYFKRNGAVEGQDPVIHFYEDFLREYDPELRKKMGAYYTPLPVVRFIVRTVDKVLQEEFDLAEGLADTAKLPSGEHRVQVLDPAVGTGTFISTVIGLIYKRLLDQGQKGRWPAYVHHDLLPRIHGFELMMAAYTIAHLKLSIAFKQTGFTIFNKRLGIYLTNSLEDAQQDSQDLFGLGLAGSIAEEAKQAAVIKNETPIMVVLGNPPYSAVSSNETVFANKLVAKYKVEPGGKMKLQERKHWLNDDYVKFIALAESMIEKNGEGIVAMITNNGYLDNPTFRGMRWHLSQTFDKIYILDLHGSTRKGETKNADENVFNIQQGVSILVAVKTGKKSTESPAEIFHAELFGSRKEKFDSLEKDPQWKQIELDQKMLYFVPKNRDGYDQYATGFSLSELFVKSTTGIVTGIDKLSIFFTKEELENTTRQILDSQDPYQEFSIKDGRKYKKEERVAELRQASANSPQPVSYRTFDDRFMYYTTKSECWINSPRTEVMNNLASNSNLALIGCKQVKTGDSWQHIFISKNIVESCLISNKTGEINYVFPLYVHDDNTVVPNLKKEIVKKMEENVGNTKPENILDYIYAVLHSPSYREKYKEFLKTDFPYVPYPKDKKQFDMLATLGKELRELHLLESKKIASAKIQYSEAGSDTIEKILYKDDRVYINATQYFGNIPGSAWNFSIGSYQPAQKWLKDRKGRVLTNYDIEHYQKIIVTITETERLMKEIDLCLRIPNQ